MPASCAATQDSALAGRRSARDHGLLSLSRRFLACCSVLALFGGAAQANPLAERLEAALQEYRRLAADPAVQDAWAEPLPPLGGRKLESGKRYAGLPLLLRRLKALGDLPADTPMPAAYTGAAVEGVIAFQRRHGLEPDGVIGRMTLAQLGVAPAVRLRQIELNIERLHQTERLAAPRMIVVNVPEFVLRGYATEGGQLKLKTRMRIIVGKALATHTPVFSEDMRYIEFSPYWNVPPSIARKETIPKLRRDPTYFDDQGFEFYANGKVITTLTAENLEAALRGELRLRQRPGAKNALGGIKFVFPNNDDIYLHHTPSVRLFQRARRDFSHGCIRVEEPLALARFVLHDLPDWDDARILAAMDAGRLTTLPLPQPLPVVIAYLTAGVGEDGRIRFFPDIYGLDKLE